MNWVRCSSPPSTNKVEVPEAFRIGPLIPYLTTDSSVLFHVVHVTTISLSLSNQQ